MKYLKCILSILSVLVLMVFSINCHAKKISYTIVGATSSCSEWTIDRDKASAAIIAKELFPVINVGKESWLMGYISGLTSGVYFEKNPLRAIDGETIFVWMDGYCSKNPISSTDVGAIELLDELSGIYSKNKKKQKQ